jgi:hypothetical protein
MKAFITGLLIILVTVSYAQTIRIADNNPNAPTGTNVFTGTNALQNAVNAAAEGDIVYIQPSLTSYGNVTVGKRIHLKGVGFYVPELGARGSMINTLTISNSDNGVHSISNAMFSGFSFITINFANGTGSGVYNNLIFENLSGTTFNHNACVQQVDGLIIRQSSITTLNMSQCSLVSNAKIYKNAIGGNVDVRNATNPLFTNNVFYKTGSTSIHFGNSTGVRLEHNIITGSGATFADMTNGIVVNNIFYGPTPNAFPSNTFYDNTFSNNLVLNAYTFPVPGNGGVNSGVGNISGTGPLFTNAPVSSSYSDTYDYTLMSGSVCIGAATTGDNIGPSGGLYPWTGTLTLKTAAIPLITVFGNSGVVPQNQPVKSAIKAKSN